MHAEDVDLSALADAVGTPFYCYSSATLARHFEVFRAALGDLDALVCYAVKANSNQAVLTTLARLGAGMDVVSEGELRRALAAGTPPGRITFSGVGKTRAEMAFALEAGIFCFNVESEPELRALSEVAQALGRTAPVALRVNPDIDARTHAKISTGKAENKFGIPLSGARAVFAEAAHLPGVRVAGVDIHIGSQITDLSPFDDAFRLTAEFVARSARRRPRHRPCRRRRRPRHPLSRRRGSGQLSPGPLCENRPRPARRTSGAPRFRAGPADRRQRRRFGDAGALRQARRGQDLRHRRRGDERPDPSDAL